MTHPTTDTEQAPEDVLLALADPIRRQILATLTHQSGATSTTLAADLPITRQAVAKHLAVLTRAGLVHTHKAGREVRYEADLQPLKQTTRWMNALATQWEHRLRAIKDLAEETTHP